MTGLILGALCLKYLSFEESHTQTRILSECAGVPLLETQEVYENEQVESRLSSEQARCSVHEAVCRRQDPTRLSADMVSPPALWTGVTGGSCGHRSRLPSKSQRMLGLCCRASELGS